VFAAAAMAAVAVLVGVGGLALAQEDDPPAEADDRACVDVVVNNEAIPCELPLEKQQRQIEAAKQRVQGRPRPSREELDRIARWLDAATPDSGIPMIGIHEGGSRLPSSDDYFVSNSWADNVGDQWIQVYAGHLASNPRQGFVWILRNPGDPDGGVIEQVARMGPGQFIEIAPDLGNMRIEAAANPALTLVAASGARFLLEVTTGMLEPAE
jgi:hypothetical protein